jgi:hypothetical protein
MKYEIKFVMTGTVTIDAEDSMEALEDAMMFSKTALLKRVEDVKYTEIRSSDGKEVVSL